MRKTKTFQTKSKKTDGTDHAKCCQEYGANETIINCRWEYKMAQLPLGKG